MNTLPTPAPDILTAYTQLTREIDHRVRGLVRHRFSAFFQCRPGCCGCCIAFSILPLEAALLQDLLRREKQTARTTSEQDNRCIFLQHDNRCNVYDRRPILCRTQGMALAYLEEESGTIEVSACPLNFSDDFPFAQDDLLFMDGFNDRLAALNLQYCRRNGLQPENRIALADISGSVG